jgi:putative IMPACT (imprinted ancient) family translation regulator
MSGFHTVLLQFTTNKDKQASQHIIKYKTQKPAATHTLIWKEIRAEVRTVFEIGLDILFFSFANFMLFIYI